jgi:hypothetical protein
MPQRNPPVPAIRVRHAVLNGKEVATKMNPKNTAVAWEFALHTF